MQDTLNRSSVTIGRILLLLTMGPLYLWTQHDKGSLAVFFNIVKKAFDPPPPSFEHHVVNFSEGILTKVRKRLSRQLSTK